MHVGMGVVVNFPATQHASQQSVVTPPFLTGFRQFSVLASVRASDSNSSS